MNVAVTGGSGFIGSRIAQRLRSRGHDVVTIGHRDEDVVVDVLDEAAAVAAVRRIGANALVHMAWSVKAADYRTSPENARWRAASAALVRAFVDAGGERVVLAGTCLEREGDDAYTVAKRTLFEALRDELGARARIASPRIYFPYGPGEPPRKLVSLVIAAIRGGSAPPLSTPDRVLDYVFVDDVAEAFARVVERGADGAIDVGTGEGATPREIALRVAERLRPDLVRAIEAIPRAGGDEPPLVADTARMRAELGEWPLATLDAGIDAMLAT